MTRTRKSALSLLLFMVIALAGLKSEPVFAQDALFNQIKIRVYFNQPPDSFEVNGKPFNISKFGIIVSVPVDSQYVVVARKEAYKPIRLELNNLRRHGLNNVRLSFKTTSGYKRAINSYFGAFSAMSGAKDSRFARNTLMGASSLIASGLSVSAIQSSDYSSDISTTLTAAAVGQALLWFGRQAWDFDFNLGSYSLESGEISSWSVSAGYSAYNPIFQDLSYSNKRTLPPLTVTQKTTISEINSTSFYVETKKYFTSALFLSAAFNFGSLSDSRFLFRENLNYGTVIRPSMSLEGPIDDNNFFLVTADVNLALFRIFGQEWSAGFGGYFGSEIQLVEEITVNNSDYHYYNVATHTETFLYETKPAGVLLAFKINHPLTNHFALTLENRILFNFKYKTNDGGKSKTLPLWQTGLRYVL